MRWEIGVVQMVPAQQSRGGTPALTSTPPAPTEVWFLQHFKQLLSAGELMVGNGDGRSAEAGALPLQQPNSTSEGHTAKLHRGSELGKTNVSGSDAQVPGDGEGKVPNNQGRDNCQ